MSPFEPSYLAFTQRDKSDLAPCQNGVDADQHEYEGYLEPEVGHDLPTFQGCGCHYCAVGRAYCAARAAKS
jgi:hypothetical protein